MKRLSVFSFVFLFLLSGMSSLSFAGNSESEPYTFPTVDCSQLKSDYDITEDGKTKKLSAVFDWSMKSENVPVIVYLIDENNNCRAVLSSWGSDIDFDKNNKSIYPDIKVLWSPPDPDNPDNSGTLYTWDGHDYESPEMAKSKKLNNQGLKLFNKGKIREAITVWKKAENLAIVPGLGYTANAEVLNNIGFAYYKLGEKYYSEAEDYLTNALQVDPRRWSIYLNLGDLYANDGNYEGAIYNYEQLLKMKPDYKYANEIKDKIKLLKTKSNSSSSRNNNDSPHPAGAAWPEFHQNNARTGLSTYDTSSDTGKLKWSYATRNLVFSSPAIGADGTIYIGSNDHNLYAINPNGALKWSYTTGDIIVSSPAIGSDGTIYVGSNDGNLYALTPLGTVKWKHTTGNSVGSSPAIGADGTIYMESSDKFYALTPTGVLKWSYTTGDWVNLSPAIGSDGTLYVGSNNGKLYAINPNGKLKWSFSTWPIASSPAIGADGTIYFGADNGKVYALTPKGMVKWSYTTDSYVKSSPAISADGTIYVGSENGKLYAINPNGKLKWSYRMGWLINESSPAIGADGTIYLGSLDGKLYAIH